MFNGEFLLKYPSKSMIKNAMNAKNKGTAAIVE